MTRDEIKTNIDIIHTQAEKLRDQGIYFQAIELYKKVLPLYENIKDDFNYGRALLQIGLCYRMANYNSNAKKMLIKTIKFSQKKKDLERTAYAYREMGTVYLNLENFPEAKKWFEKSIQLLEKSGFIASYGMSLSRLGLTHMHLRNYKKAEKLMLQGLKIIEKTDHWFFQISTLFFLGKFYFLRKKYQKSIDLLEMAEKILDKNQQTEIHTRRYGQIWGVLAYNHLRLKNLELAKEYYLNAIEHLFSIPNNVAVPIYQTIQTSEFLEELMKLGNKTA